MQGGRRVDGVEYAALKKNDVTAFNRGAGPFQSILIIDVTNPVARNLNGLLTQDTGTTTSNHKSKRSLIKSIEKVSQGVG